MISQHLLFVSGVALFWVVPGITSLVLMLGLARREVPQARWVLGSSAVTAVGAWIWAVAWIARMEFRLETPSFFVDRTSVVFLLLTQTLMALVLRFSRVYMHREPGFRRYFAILFLFQMGLNFMVTAAHLNLLFAGWEVVGLASFLLIGFYSHRHQPIRHALGIFAIYRLCDLGILLSAALEHHFFKGMGTMAQWQVPNSALPMDVLLLIILTAMGKSAQFPFTSWLPKAMEGPTPSSAAFYGALSVHAGVFLLMRSQNLWWSSDGARLAIATIGLITAVVSWASMRIQANAKGQIAYASTTQVGLIWLELALGLETLALAHVVGNACLRTVQLLLSPSLLADRLKELNRTDVRPRVATFAPSSTLYALAHQTFYLDAVMNFIFWNPVRRMGWGVARVFVWGRGSGNSPRRAVLLPWIGLCMAMGCPHAWWPVALALVALGGALHAFVQKHRGVVASNMCLSVAALSALGFWQGHALYALGTLPVAVAGAWILRAMNLPATVEHGEYHGRMHTHPRHAWALLVLTLAWLGMPGSPAFFGEDALISHAMELGEFQRIIVVTCIAMTIVLHGITSMRFWAHACWGPRPASTAAH